MPAHQLLVPAYKLTFSRDAALGGGASQGAPGGTTGQVIDTTDEPQASTVVDLEAVLDMDTPADSLRLVMGQVGSFRPALGDAVKVELGYADDTRGLFHVLSVGLTVAEPGLTARRLLGLSTADRLLHTRVDEHFVGKSAADIVRDLAGRAEVEVETAETGIRFPSYVVDGRRSVYDHLRDIADLCGFDLYVNPEGKLVFERFVGGKTVHVLEYGEDILALELVERTPRATRVEAFGESPGASAGEDRWAWLTKDFTPNVGVAGQGEPSLLLQNSTLRSASAAGTAARARLTHLQRQTKRGRVLLTGQPQIKLGDTVRLDAVPEAGVDGSYQVRAVTHRLTKSTGFTTTVEFRSLAS